MAGLNFMLLQVSAVIGRLFWGAVADRLIQANFLLVFIGFLTAVCCVFAGCFTADWPIIGIVIVSLLLGLTSSGWNGIFFSELVKYAPKHRTGDVAGEMQSANLAGVSCLPPLFGIVISLSDGFLTAFVFTAILVSLGAGGFACSLKS